MANKTKLVIFMLMCSACDMTKVYYPATIVYPEKDQTFVDICIKDSVHNVDKCVPLNVSNIDLHENAKPGLSSVPLDYINVYQDIDRKCYMYSYSRAELLDKKQKAGFKISAKNTFLVINRNGVYFTDKYEDFPLNKITKFQPDLCKKQ